jgi:hypothetical protein
LKKTQGGALLPRKLRAVKPGETGKRLSVVEAAELNDRRALLLAMQQRLALALSDSLIHPRDLAALSKRLEDSSKELAVIDAAAAGEDDEAAPVPDEEWDGSV